MREAWDTVVAYKLVWVRVLFFVLGPCLASFLAMAQTIDMDTKWPQMGTFARTAFWIGVAYPGFSSLMAFIDQSLNRAKEELREKRKGDTEFITKAESGKGFPQFPP